MKTLKITALLTYDDDLTHGDDEQAIEWFMGILKGDALTVVDRSDVGDEIGNLNILTIEDGDKDGTA